MVSTAGSMTLANIATSSGHMKFITLHSVVVRAMNPRLRLVEKNNFISGERDNIRILC